MKDTIKTIARCVVVGAACRAGESLWDNVLEEKVCKLAKNLKKKLNTMK